MSFVLAMISRIEISSVPKELVLAVASNTKNDSKRDHAPNEVANCGEAVGLEIRKYRRLDERRSEYRTGEERNKQSHMI